MEGWIKLHRKLLDNPIIRKPKYFLVWVVLLLSANHEDTKFIFNGVVQVCKRGQFLTGRKKLSQLTGVRESTIEDVLNYLETQHQIQQQKNNKFRLITILNYEDYQTSQQQIQQLSDNKATTKQQPADTNKNDNNDNNEKNDKKNNNINTVAVFFEKNIGLLTPYICEELEFLIKEHTEPNVLIALKKTIEAGKRGIAYTKGILNNEKAEGYSWKRLPKKDDDPILAKLPFAIRKQIEVKIKQYQEHLGEYPKPENIKVMIEKLTHEKVR
jgi:DnaD/phage-associated family protein